MALDLTKDGTVQEMAFQVINDYMQQKNLEDTQDMIGPALRVLGSLIQNEDNQLALMLLDKGILKTISYLFRSCTDPGIIKECIWMLNNMAICMKMEEKSLDRIMSDNVLIRHLLKIEFCAKIGLV